VTPEQLSALLVRALSVLVERGSLELAGGVPESVRVERPKVREHGDYSTNIAMQLGKAAARNPRELAQELADVLGEDPSISGVEVAGPGFLNVRVAAGVQGAVAAQIVEAGESYGRGGGLSGESINVEFISANPTGPLHLGHTRWAVVGDAIARVLEAAGADVTREFYVNDRGNQMDKFGASLRARALGSTVPEDGYHGEYVATLAERIVTAHPEILDLQGEDQAIEFRERGYTLQLAEQREQLEAFGTHFDVWFSERSLHGEGPGTPSKVDHALDVLAKHDHLYESEGALWMRTTDFGDDKDRVLRRSNGELTYFASDAAYYVDKRERGFARCLYLLGADHHGYVGRLAAMASCAGDDPQQHLEVLIGQLVKIMREGVEMKLSKRSGTIVTLAELVELVGVDALRYTLSRYPADTPLTLDVADMTKRANDNPVYYVQYAHARLSSILRNSADLGVQPQGADPALLATEAEGVLLRALAEYPAVVVRAAELREPHRIARYLERTAATFHAFYDVCRVLPQGDEEPTPLHSSRVLLVAATRQVIANGLELLGVSAPERM
jgi:arginyl-tRNA synthetase